MKRGTKIVILAAALALLIGAWALAANMTRQREARQAEQAQAEPIDIAVGAAEDVTALRWNYLGDEVRLAKQDGQWVNADDETCPIDQDAVSPLVEAVAGAAAEAVVEDVTDFAPYGLAEHAVTVTAEAGEQSVTYALGGTSLGGRTYVRVDGGSDVFTETGGLSAAFETQLDGLLALEEPPAMAQVTALAFESDVASYAVLYHEDGGESAYTDAYTWFHASADGAEEPLDETHAKTLCELASRIQLTDCVTWNAEDPAAYGLAAPQGAASVTYLDENGEEGTFALRFGDYTDDGSVYVSIADSSMVYRVSGTVLDGLMYPDWPAMANMDIAALPADWLQNFTVERDGQRYDVVRTAAEIGPEESAADAEEAVESATDAEEETQDVYTLDGRTLDSALVDSWLREVRALRAESTADGKEGREQMLRITFQQERAACPTVTFTFWSYDSAKCLCVVDDGQTERRYFVSRTSTISLWDDAWEFLAELPQETA